MKSISAVPALFLAVILPCSVAMAQPATGGYNIGGFGPTYSNSGGLTPSDSDGALGRTYLVLKANNSISFTARSALSAGGGNSTGSPLSDWTFWAEAINGTQNPTTYTIPASQLLHPGSLASLPSGVASFVLRGDGHVVYDPNDGCGDGQGRWLIVEMADFTYSNGTTAEGLLVGVTSTETPDPNNGAAWHVFGIVTVFPTSVLRAADYPQIGFNTDWVTVTANFFFPNSSGQFSIQNPMSPPIQFAFKPAAECGGSLTSSVNVMSAVGGLCSGPEGTGSGPAWYCNYLYATSSCPAQTYYTFGQDPDGSHEYLVRSDSANSAAELFLIDDPGGTGQPVYQGPVMESQITTQPYPGDGTAWNPNLPALSQDGTNNNTLVQPGLDDRFTGCVVRNDGIWATQTVGLPASSATTDVAQMWNIGVDNYLGTIYQFQRVGGTAAGYIYDTPPGTTPMNVMVPSIGVDYYSNVVMGFEVLPATGQNPLVGYLDQGYSLKSYSSVSFYAPRIVANGGPYFPSTTVNTVRSGDYTAAGVDPTDDYSLWTVGDYAQNNAWGEYWEIMSPQTPAQPSFVGYNTTENECYVNVGQPCDVTIQAPSGLQKGDTVYAIVNTIIDTSVVPVSTHGADDSFVLIPMSNGSQDQQVIYNDPYCGSYPVTWWIYAHKYTGASDTGQYTFQTTESAQNCSYEGYQWSLVNELPVSVVAYRNASRSLFAPAGLGNYILTGNTVAANSTISVGPTNFPGNEKLANLFTGSTDSSETGACLTFSNFSGSPAATLETPTQECSDAQALLDADLWSGSGGTFGPYSVSDGYSLPKAAWQLLMYDY